MTEREEWEKHQELLLGELAHRVRNTLAIVRAIAHQTLHCSKSSEDFVARFDGRLSALANAHSLLVRSDWQGADLAALAQGQLEPYTSDDPDRVRLDGEPVVLPADLATPFGLILHELAVNAAKHGSLSRPSGTVKLSWTLDSRSDSCILKVLWREEGGPLITRWRANGFGSVLIENGIPSATIFRKFDRGGLICNIELRLDGA